MARNSARFLDAMGHNNNRKVIMERKKKGGVRVFRLYSDGKTMEFKRNDTRVCIEVFEDKSKETIFHKYVDIEDLFDLSVYITKVLEQNYFAALVNFNRSYERFEKATKKVLNSV
jgi:hypothetical protein